MTDKQFRAGFLDRAVMPVTTVTQGVLGVMDEYIRTREKTLSTASELGVGYNGMIEIKSKAAHAFVKRWMMLRYASVDLSFIQDKKWWLRMERDVFNNVTITGTFDFDVPPSENPPFIAIGCVNRYFEVTEDIYAFAFGMREKGQVKQKAGSFAASRKRNEPLAAMEVEVAASLPDGVGQKHVNIARTAMSHFHLSKALLYARGIDLIEELTGDKVNRWSRVETPGSVRIIFAPNRESLSVRVAPVRPKGDPAIILDLFDQHYLLDFYDTPNEAPIERMIREFSEGSLPKK